MRSLGKLVGRGRGVAAVLILLLAGCGLGALTSWAAVAAAPAPTILTPAAGEVITERRPTVSGTGDPTLKVAVTLDGAEVCPAKPVQPDGTWSCQPSADLPLGTVTLSAVQVGPADEVSPPATVTFEVVSAEPQPPEPAPEPQPEPEPEERPEPPVITVPRDDSRSHDRTPTVSGRDAVPGAKVVVHDRDRRVCTATADRNGRWTCTLTARLAWGRHLLSATQRVSGMESRRSTRVVLTIVRPAPQETPAPPPATPQPTTTATPTPTPPTPAQPTPTQPTPTQPTPSPTAVVPTQPSPAPPTATAGPQPTDGDADGSGDSAGDRDRDGDDAGDGGRAVPDESSGTRARPDQGPLSIDVRVPPAPLVRGQAATLTGSIGPAREAGEIVVRGSLTPGLRYRDVRLAPGGDCVVRTLEFRCTLDLAAGEVGGLRVVLTPDADAAPALARQQLSVTSADGRRDGVTSTLAVDPGVPGTAEARSGATYAAQFVPLLALLMFALAAHVSERRRIN
ncbi:hypothetical protein [Nocardioides sp. SYSU D00065]|uniref:hypothetical protein n=1 Tax=Nocardioides sp. SYSU D00065 TaxID=2817378 RepID=UPI001B334FAB|nr:hypothetical protein [Nocardioides sp. SYSU D00065]